MGPAGIRTQDLLSTSQTLLPLSHWAHGRGAEARLYITAQARGLSRFQLSFSLSRLFHCQKWRSPADGVTGLGGLTVQTHCLSGHSHCPPPQPPAQLSPYTLSPIIQQASNAELHIKCTINSDGLRQVLCKIGTFCSLHILLIRM